jgi:hypothetical protein
MATAHGAPLLNPFDEDIVYEPRCIEPPVPGLNDAPFGAVLEELARLDGEPIYRAAKASHSLLVTSPQAGYGKSHLIGRLFQALTGRATCVYVRPFEDPASCWKSILERLVHELDYTERGAGQPQRPHEITQLDALAHGVLSHLAADLLASGVLRSRRQEPAEIARMLRERPLEQYTPTLLSGWTRQLQALFARPEFAPVAVRRMRTLGVELQAAPGNWLRVLFSYFQCGDELLREGCLDWLMGDSIDEALSDRIGLTDRDLPKAELSASEANELCKNRILDLCRLAGFYRPFLFCFDQTENYGKDPALARALGAVTQVVTDEARNQLTLITANLDPWEQRIRPHWEEAQLHRLGRVAHQLQGLTSGQGEHLVRQRLQAWQIPPERILVFLDSGRRLVSMFSDTPQIGVRSFLQRCYQEWQEFQRLPAAAPASLAELFKQYCDEVASQPGRLVFDRDALFWLVTEVARGLPGVEVGRVQGRSGHAVPRWSHEGRQILFDFEGGSHWRRWQSIARRTGEYCSKHPGSKVVYFRTPELRSIPGRWQVAPEVEDAKRRHLHIETLDLGRVTELYAARELYADAIQGDISFSAEAVLEFLRERLQPWWERVLRGLPQEPGVPPVTPATDSDELLGAVRAAVQRDKFLSLDELLTSLPSETSREAVLEACGRVREIRVHASPTMTVLQWQSGASP